MTGEVARGGHVDGRCRVSCDQVDHNSRREPGEVAAQLEDKGGAGAVAAADHCGRLIWCAHGVPGRGRRALAAVCRYPRGRWGPLAVGRWPAAMTALTGSRTVPWRSVSAAARVRNRSWMRRWVAGVARRTVIAAATGLARRPSQRAWALVTGCTHRRVLHSAWPRPAAWSNSRSPPGATAGGAARARASSAVPATGSVM